MTHADAPQRRAAIQRRRGHHVRRPRGRTSDELVPHRRAALIAPGRWWVGLLAAGGLGAIAAGLLPTSAWPRAAAYDAVVGLALAGCAVGARRNRGLARSSWRWVVAGVGSLFGAEVARSGLRVAGGPRFPPLADALVLLAYGLLAVGVGSLVRRHGAGQHRANLLDALVVTVALAALSWPVLLQPDDVGRTSGVEELVRAAHPLADILLGAAAVALLLVASRRTPGLFLLFGGLALMLVGDVAFRVSRPPSTSRELAVDLSWLVAYLLIGAATLHPTSSEVEPAARRPAGRTRILGMLTVSVVCPGVLLLTEWSAGRLDLPVLVPGVGGMVVFALVAARLWSLIGAERATAVLQGMNRLASLVHSSRDAIFVVDRAGRIAYASRAVETMTGARADDLVGVELAACFTGTDADGVVRQLINASRLPQGRGVELAGRYSDADGETRDFEMTIVNLLDDRDVQGLVVTMRDVTPRKQLERELHRRAFRDDLTGLANRPLFMDRLEHALLRLQRSRSTVAVLFVDLDDFKAVNDGLGHSAGDALLVAVADRLQCCMRPSDTIARMGGDEFAVLLEEIDDRDAVVAAAERLLESLQLPVAIGELAVNVPASIGIAVTDEPAAPESLMRDADIALYRAKANGKGRLAEFDASMRWEAYERLRLRTELAQAVEADELQLVFQPIVSVAADRIVGAEALVRWEHPKLGTIPPLDFIPLAEETGLILTIGRWVLDTACRAAAAWNARDASDAGDEATGVDTDVYVSVNVSARQLRESGFAKEVIAVLERASLPPDLLMLELTESVLVDEVAAKNLVDHVVPLGVAIAIDDFGTGYSSLAYLQRLPVHAVKIDRSFVTQMEDRGARAVVESISAIANVMGYRSIAEGVETDEQLDGVVGFDCRYVQGYRYSRPVDQHTFARMLEAGDAWRAVVDAEASAAAPAS